MYLFYLNSLSGPYGIPKHSSCHCRVFHSRSRGVPNFPKRKYPSPPRKTRKLEFDEISSKLHRNGKKSSGYPVAGCFSAVPCTWFLPNPNSNRGIRQRNGTNLKNSPSWMLPAKKLTRQVLVIKSSFNNLTGGYVNLTVVNWSVLENCKLTVLKLLALFGILETHESFFYRSA